MDLKGIIKDLGIQTFVSWARRNPWRSLGLAVLFTVIVLVGKLLVNV
jgi:hypothetical protein